MKKAGSILLAILMILCTIPLSVSAAGSTTLTLSPSASGIRVGDTVTITGNLNGTEKIGTFDLNIVYPAGNLQYEKTDYIVPVIEKGELDIVQGNGSVHLLYLDGAAGLSGIQSGSAFKVVFKVIGGNPGDSISVDAQIKTVGNADAAAMTASVNKATMRIEAPLSGNVFLSSLTVSNASISPAFDKNKTAYKASVPFSVEKLEIQATAEDATAKVAVNSPALTPGGTTTASITVTAQNGAKRSYTIQVERAQDPNYKPSGNNNLKGITVDPGILSPAFKSYITRYVVWLPFEVDKISVAGAAEDAKASVKVNGGSQLEAGKDTVVFVICTAENGDQKSYRVIARRASANIDGSGNSEEAIDANEIKQKLAEAGKKGAAQTVVAHLGANNGPLDSSVFNALADNKEARLNIKMSGAQITFHGSDVKKQNTNQTYNLFYTAGSSYKDEMQKKAGDGSEIFTYSFAYHGNLPGYATFDIDTDFAPGEAVNVYQYRPESKSYILIAKNVQVSAGGVVSYNHNTCSDYLITPKAISGAGKSVSVSKQTSGMGSPLLFVIIVGGVALVAGMILGILLNMLLRRAGKDKKSGAVLGTAGTESSDVREIPYNNNDTQV